MKYIPEVKMDISIQTAGPQHLDYAEDICREYSESAKARGTGIAERQPAYIREKMNKGNAVIALHNGQVAGFVYIETWSHDKYVANSGLIVFPHFRRMGLARQLKRAVFQLSRDKYPSARVFGITTSLAVMKINSALGYQPVTFSELTQDEAFWSGCKSCPNYDILTRNDRRMCLCTAMLAPSKEEVEQMELDLTDMIIKKD